MTYPVCLSGQNSVLRQETALWEELEVSDFRPKESLLHTLLPGSYGSQAAYSTFKKRFIKAQRTHSFKSKCSRKMKGESVIKLEG